MIELQILIVISTIAITLAGFAGIVGIFADNLSSQKTFRLGTLLFQSGVALFASLASLIFYQINDVSSIEANQKHWVISSYVYIFIATLALIQPTIDIFKSKRYLDFSYDRIYYFLFLLVIAILILNVIFIKEAYLFHAALVINLAYGFVTFFNLVMPSK
tara:strand:- start:452 stop:931 length:480 start_codon:yes stop_codon:yes gene_type:complete